MTDRINLKPWSISDFHTAWADDFAESVFFIGNGRMGARGYLPFEPEGRAIQRGLFIAGVFGEIKPGITDIVNLPTPIWESIRIDGKPAELASPIDRELNLQTGEFIARFSLNACGKSVDVCYRRFFSLDNTGLILQRTEYSARQKLDLTVCSGIFMDSVNCPVPDDQTKDNVETIALAIPHMPVIRENGFERSFDVLGTSLQCAMYIDFMHEGWQNMGVSERDGGYGAVFSVCLNADETAALEKQAFIRTSRDVDPRIVPPETMQSYNALLEASRLCWRERWDACNICETAWNADALSALRYNAFQLIASCSSKDSSVSIGARGLTHTRYKGCYFWDTDFFMLPFYLDTNPEAAKNLCLYRFGTLFSAKEHSRKLNTAGARFPWMCSLDGSEQCETWDIGMSELHITADVVYALAAYCERTKDDAFRLDCASELWIETARFWHSRYSWNDRLQRFDLLFCKGPDEYCGIANNNLFTNVMVQYNLELAIRAAVDLKAMRPEIYARLAVTEEEVAAWQFMHDRIPWARDPYSGRLTSDDGFHLLEPVDITKIKNGDAASYHSVCFDRLQRYKLVKQADVLLLMTRLPERFTDEEKQHAWADFEPICLHDSTLSFATHALFAAMNGIKKCEEYFYKALFLDLRDVMGNTGKEGLHFACMGESWQVAQLLQKNMQSSKNP